MIPVHNFSTPRVFEVLRTSLHPNVDGKYVRRFKDPEAYL